MAKKSTGDMIDEALNAFLSDEVTKGQLKDRLRARGFVFTEQGFTKPVGDADKPTAGDKSDTPHRWLTDAEAANHLRKQGYMVVKLSEAEAAQHAAASADWARLDRPASSPLISDGHGHIDASFPGLPPLPKFDPRQPPIEGWRQVDLSRFGNVPVSTVIETLDILGLEVAVQVRTA